MTPPMLICILGATGLVGRETLTLVDRAWPGAELALFASRDQTLEHGGQSLEVLAAQRLEAADAPRGDVAFVALDDEFSRRYVPRLLELGYRTIDKSNTYRLEPKVPLVVAGVNEGEVGSDTRLVANPNCTTIPLALALSPIDRYWRLQEVSVSTYQAISGAGQGPLDDFLAASNRGYGDADRLGHTFDANNYAGNVVPHNGKTDESGFSAEERKLVAESRKILERPDLAVVAQCCRVPVAVGHYENVWITVERPTTLEELTACWNDRAFVRHIPGSAGEGLTALATVHDRDRALVGRVRVDPRGEPGRRFCLTVAADNLRLGAATNAVRIASQWFPAKDADLQAPGQMCGSLV